MNRKYIHLTGARKIKRKKISSLLHACTPYRVHVFLLVVFFQFRHEIINMHLHHAIFSDKVKVLLVRHNTDIPITWKGGVSMDIAKMSMTLNQAHIQQQASLSVMKKAMDHAEGNGEFIDNMLGDTDVQALQQAANPHLGASIDIKG